MRVETQYDQRAKSLARTLRSKIKALPSFDKGSGGKIGLDIFYEDRCYLVEGTIFWLAPPSDREHFAIKCRSARGAERDALAAIDKSLSQRKVLWPDSGSLAAPFKLSQLVSEQLRRRLPYSY